MASYKNPYNTQQNQAVNSIGNSLAEIFMPNSNTATSADLYVQRANRYAQLADKTELEAIEQNVKNQKAIRQAENLEYLMNSPEVTGMLNNQLGVEGRLAQIIAGSLMEKDPTLINNRFALRQMQNMKPAQQQQAARNQVFARGQQPSNTFAINEYAAEAANQRMIERSIAQAKGIAPFNIARDNNRAFNQMERQNDEQNFTGEQNTLNRDLRREEGAANRQARRDEGDENRQVRRDEGQANRDSREGIAQAGRDERANKPVKMSDSMKRTREEHLDDITPWDSVEEDYVYRDLGNGDGIDRKIQDYTMARFEEDLIDAYENQRMSEAEAFKYARMGLTRPAMMKVKRFEVPGLGNDAYLPRVVIEDLKDMPQRDRLPVVMGFDFSKEQAEFILSEITK